MGRYIVVSLQGFLLGLFVLMTGSFVLLLGWEGGLLQISQ